MQYKQHASTSLFVPDPADTAIAAAWYFAKSNIAVPPPLVSLPESWGTYIGFYLFLENPVEAADTAALDALAASLAGQSFTDSPVHTGAAWVLNTADGKSVSVKTILNLNKEATPILSENAEAGFGRYRLPFFAGMPATFDAAAFRLHFGYPEQDGAQAPSIVKGLTVGVLGTQSGVISGEAMISDFSSNPLTGWSAGFMYVSSINGGQGQFYPMFDLDANRYLVFAVRWDPLHPLDPKRSSLTFTGISFVVEKVPGTIDGFQILPQQNPNLLNSHWKTLYGKPIALSPVLSGDNPAQLVFQQGIDLETGNAAYYLSPSGAYELRVPDGVSRQVKMLCGLAGTECIEVTLGDGQNSGDQLIFYPGNAAYTRDFPVVQPSAALAGVLRATVSDSFLNNTYTTGWAVVEQQTGNPDVLYFAAPATASLYRPGTMTGVYDSYYTQTAKVTAMTPGGGPFCFPMAPYAGIVKKENASFSQADTSKFELQIIGAARKKLMATLPLALAPSGLMADPVVTTTPQGLLATILAGAWKKVLLAKNTEILTDFAFTNLPDILRNTFQTNELFLVASDNTNLGGFQNVVGIEGWTFNVNVPRRDPDKDPEHKNILLLKFRKGAIVDLAQDVNSWTNAQQFNYDADQLTGVQTWLIQYCTDAIAMAASNSRYAHFASIVQDPNWYGVLALKVDVGLGGFPGDLKGLLGAMDISLLNAHHVGVQVNYIESGASIGASAVPSIEVKKSNLFALISYIDPGYKDSQGGGQSAVAGADPSLSQVAYAYKVLTLQVVFLNSAIVNFESKLELTAREWFDESATLNKPGSNNGTGQPANYAMLFNGHYENHDGHRTYTFLTQKGLTYQYFITSRIINYVQFVKASFGTFSTIKDTTDPDKDFVNSRFTFYGYVNFLSLPNLDCFSFGSEVGQETLQNRGLYFSNMGLDVSFTLNTVQNTTTDLSLVFSPTQVAFDMSLSTVRMASFAQGFPLSPAAIVQGTGGNTPSQGGYVAVTPPVDFIGGTLGSGWYGLDMEFHWGGPGALADMAGFTPHLLLAWSPSATQSVGIFIRLPGSAGGGKTFSLQNVLKITSGTLRLQVVKDQQGKVLSYNLLLTSLALSILGLKFPPVGNTNLALLGDPEQPGTMGWYGAFINKETV
ncbi:MAG TPA: hypothetical protein VHC47_03805 [Mucilaginibacter sp.]|nr:hypothetical protein [Mucilaginibacter sp.]